VFIGNEHKFFKHRLSNQHTVEWITVWARQAACHLPMSNTDRQANEALIRGGLVKIGDDRGNFG